jgi:hypothetical protein
MRNLQKITILLMFLAAGAGWGQQTLNSSLSSGAARNEPALEVLNKALMYLGNGLAAPNEYSYRATMTQKQNDSTYSTTIQEWNLGGQRRQDSTDDNSTKIFLSKYGHTKLLNQETVPNSRSTELPIQETPFTTLKSLTFIKNQRLAEISYVKHKDSEGQGVVEITSIYSYGMPVTTYRLIWMFDEATSTPIKLEEDRKRPSDGVFAIIKTIRFSNYQLIGGYHVPLNLIVLGQNGEKSQVDFQSIDLTSHVSFGKFMLNEK